RIIGKVISKGKNPVYLKTDIGGKRLIGMLSGEQLPRIC
ncbi:MAG: hydrogenase expression/formation protein HypE, partial [Atribacterota bacterium]|nr:hydrogenase expression/formation protein HypE [Atribacterota bacterium]